MSNEDDQFAELIGAAADAGPYVVIHVKDPAALVAAKGGDAGVAAFKLVPGTVTAQVYNTIRDQIAAGFKDQGVDAEVKVVDNRPPGGSMSRDFLFGALAGATSVGIGYGLFRLIKKLLER